MRALCPRRCKFEVTGPITSVLSLQSLQTGLDIWQMAMFRFPRNFTKPDQFIPDRWLPGSPRFKEFAGDRQQAFQPFSAGPRNCIGRK
jgi:hypothetical protein